MDGTRSLVRSQLVIAGSLVLMALLVGVRVVEYEPSPWGLVGFFAIGTMLVVGPVSWLVRDRMSEKQQTQLRYATAAIAVLCVPIVIGIGLLVGGLLVFIDSLVLGSIIGLAATTLITRLLSPQIPLIGSG